MGATAQSIFEKHLAILKSMTTVLHFGRLAAEQPRFLEFVLEPAIAQRTRLRAVRRGVHCSIKIDIAFPSFVHRPGLRMVGHPEVVVQGSGHHAGHAVQHRTEHPRGVGPIKIDSRVFLASREKEKDGNG